MRVVSVLLLFSAIALAFFLLNKAPEEREQNKVVREPAVAGSWYPGDTAALEKTVGEFLENAQRVPIEGKVRALIVPHAGYSYSGQVAAHAFKQLDRDYSSVLLMGPSHYVPFSGISIANVTHYRTPLGDIALSPKVDELRRSPLVHTVPEAHKKEHALEMELPFLQSVLSSFELVPMLVGQTLPDDIAMLLQDLVDRDTLVVVSVDLSHYHPYEEAVALDAEALGNIETLNAAGILSNEIDARGAVAALLLLAKGNGWTPQVVKYMNSGDVTGKKDKVVGYAAVVFTSEEGLNKEEQQYLLQLARKTLESSVREDSKPKVNADTLPDSLIQEQGCFVTLNKDHRLRGCIGHILPKEELYQCVIDNAVNAARNDRRFNPVTADELESIEVEVSVLTVPELTGLSGDELLDYLVPEKHGVVLKSGWSQSTYLPQVWEQIADKTEFLSNLCQKGGMAINCWQDPEVEVYTYEAQVFHETS
jgi:AmmeMemoRadiSam system protein B/AmmeMemoRadiSam system protein A